MKGSPIARGRGKQKKKTLGETIKKDSNVNDLSINMIYDRIIWRRLINVDNPT